MPSLPLGDVRQSSVLWISLSPLSQAWELGKSCTRDENVPRSLRALPHRQWFTDGETSFLGFTVQITKKTPDGFLGWDKGFSE